MNKMRQHQTANFFNVIKCTGKMEICCSHFMMVKSFTPSFMQFTNEHKAASFQQLISDNLPMYNEH